MYPQHKAVPVVVESGVLKPAATLSRMSQGSLAFQVELTLSLYMLTSGI